MVNSGQKPETGTDCHWHWFKHWKYWFKTLDFTGLVTELILTNKTTFLHQIFLWRDFEVFSGLFLSSFWSTKVISSRFKVFLSQKSWFCFKKQWLSVKNSAADAALALKSTGTGLGTENATATVYHPAKASGPFLCVTPSLTICVISFVFWHDMPPLLYHPLLILIGRIGEQLYGLYLLDGVLKRHAF